MPNTCCSNTIKNINVLCTASDTLRSYDLTENRTRAVVYKGGLIISPRIVSSCYSWESVIFIRKK